MYPCPGPTNVRRGSMQKGRGRVCCWSVCQLQRAQCFSSLLPWRGRRHCFQLYLLLQTHSVQESEMAILIYRKNPKDLWNILNPIYCPKPTSHHYPLLHDHTVGSINHFTVSPTPLHTHTHTHTHVHIYHTYKYTWESRFLPLNLPMTFILPRIPFLFSTHPKPTHF